MESQIVPEGKMFLMGCCAAALPGRFMKREP
jgi:hypothetical protein